MKKIKLSLGNLKNLFNKKSDNKFKQTRNTGNTVGTGGYTAGTSGTSGTSGTTTRNAMSYKPLPFIGHLPLKMQYSIGAGFLGVNLLFAVSCMGYYYVGLTNVNNAINNSNIAKTEVQRAAKNMTYAMNGDEKVFEGLGESLSILKDSVEKSGSVLKDFDEHQTFKLFRSIEKVKKNWVATEPAIKKTLVLENLFVGLNSGNIKALELGDSLISRMQQNLQLLIQSGASDAIVEKALFSISVIEKLSKNSYALAKSSIYLEDLHQLLLNDGQLLKKLMDDLVFDLEDSKQNELMKKIASRVTYTGYDIDIFDALISALAENKKKNSSLYAASDKFKTVSDTISHDLSQIIDDYTQKLSQVNLRAYAGGIFGLLGILSFIVIVLINLKESQRQAIETKQEQISTQNAIMRLLDELGDLADGDLTVRATVSEEVTGAIADSVNFAISQLSDLVGSIQIASNQIDAATKKASDMSHKLLEINSKQTVEITETSNAVLRIAKSIEEVSKRMTDSQKVAEQSVDSANKGMIAISESINGIKSIQVNVEETARRIGRLTDQSQQISEIIDLIADISERTSVLAINATVQATKAGAAGKGFKVVADAVQDLANQASESTKKIGALINAIQTDIAGAGEAMIKTSSEANKGAELVESAGEVFAEIGDVSMALADIVAEINTEIAVSAKDASNVTETVKSVLVSVNEASDSTKTTDEAISEISNLSERLRESVAGFKV